jgi:pyruvate dehydrogenase E2 component (dihydrolipoamide acetyltransferase)
MAEPVLMPQVGQDIKTARIVDWLKKENQEVKKGEVIAVVESDKAAFDVEAYTSGVLLKILYPEGQEVEVLTPIAYIGRPGEPIGDAKQTMQDRGQTIEVIGAESAIRSHVTASEARPPQSAIGERPAVSPSARRLAQEMGVNLQTVKGTGPGGRITKEDILTAARVVPASASEGVVGWAWAPNREMLRLGTPSAHADHLAANQEQHGPKPILPVSQATPEDTIVVFTAMRARIAERLTRSKQTIPHFYISMEVDMSEAMTWRRQFNESRQTKVTITDMIVKAAAKALRQYPRMNAHVEPDKIILKRAVNIGVAVSVDEGLIVPVIAEADGKSLVEISSAARENGEAARAGRLKPPALGSFTVTNLGMFAVDTFVPVINPPEAAILAVGAVAKRPAVVDGQVVPRDRMTMVLACDHRAVDGTYAAQFLGKIKEHLENPASLEA